MIPFRGQLKLLLWKAYVIKKKQKVWLVVEMAVPVLLFALLVLIRTRNFNLQYNQCHYDAKAFPSAGVLPFIQSLLCSLSNDCRAKPTNADDTYYVNQNSGNHKKTVLVEFARWASSLLALVGEKPDNWISLMEGLAQLVHTLAGNMTEGSQGLTYPFALFYITPQHMLESLQSDFGYDKKNAQKFLNISVTFSFLVEAYEEYSSLTSQNFSIFDLISKGKIAFLCSNSSTMLIEGAVEDVDLCNHWTYSNLGTAILLNPQQFSLQELPYRLLNRTLQIISERSIVKLSTATMYKLVEDFRFAVIEINKLPKLNWGLQMTKASLMDAVFCGDITEMLKRDKGNKPIAFQMPPAMMSIQSAMIGFVQNNIRSSVSDAAATKKYNNTACANISLIQPPECDVFLRFSVKSIKTLLLGRILVAPDVPVVRALLDHLNSPLQQANLLKNSLLDLAAMAGLLQDSIYLSDVQAMLGNVEKLVPELGKDGNGSLSWLTHLLGSSSDPHSLMALMQQGTAYVDAAFKCFRLDRFVLVKDERELEKQAMCLTEAELYLSGLVVLNVSSSTPKLPSRIAYKLRHLPNLVDGTGSQKDNRRNVLSRDDPWNDLKYLTYGFSFLQEAVDRAFISMVTNKSIPTGLQAQQEPYPCVNTDSFNVTPFLALFLILSWMIPASLLVKNIVWEKEMRLKEIMRVMGLGDAIHWLGWALQALFLNAVSVLIICLLLKYGNILRNTDISLLAMLLGLFSVSSVCQCLFLSTLFSKANIATVSTSLLFFLLFFPFQLSIRAESVVFSHLALLLPQTAVGYGLWMVASNDDIGKSTWHNLPHIQLDSWSVLGMTLQKVLLALAVDCVVYVGLAWYISAVFPGVYGIHQKWYFPATKRFWKTLFGWDTANKESMNLNGEPSTTNDTEQNQQCTDFEPAEKGVQATVRISQLTKVYSNDTKALDSLSVDFYKSQITAFLGHNGAGKTTTISILTGLYTPSKGTAYIYGKDICWEMRTIRDYIGYCPQHNILFDGMTVEEQLYFYASLKGVEKGALAMEVTSILLDIGLQQKRTALANTLSGGMKRKLCIGIALIGGSKLIILDEPTAGIDAFARRAIWQLLLKHKKGRTMILSTQHMDEADVLADRIAILSEGKLKSSCTSLFLKKRYGNGYLLILAKSYVRLTVATPLPLLPQEENEFAEEVVSEPTAKCLLEEASPPSPQTTLKHFIEKFCGKNRAELLEDVEFESVYKLPLDICFDKLAALFEGLEQHKEFLGIDSYGLSAPSLQQIFLTESQVHDLKLKKELSATGLVHYTKQLVRNFQSKSPSVGAVSKSQLELRAELVEGEGLELADPKALPDYEHPVTEFVHGWTSLQIHHTKALLRKRLIVTRRSGLSLFAELVLPLCLLLAAEVYICIQTPQGTSIMAQKALALTPVSFGNATNHYFGLWDNGSTASSTARQYLQALVQPPCLSVHYMDNIIELESLSTKCQWETAHRVLNLTASNTPYNIPQKCGCSIKNGWNCTFNDYPSNQLYQLVLNTTDVLWDLSGRNISQYRLITSENTTNNPSKHLFIGGWTFGHTNMQSPNQNRVSHILSGLEHLLVALQNFTATIHLDWRAAVGKTSNLALSNDPFNANMTVLEAFKTFISYFDTSEINKIWFNNKIYSSLPINTNSYYNAVLRSMLPKEKATKAGILAYSHPMNQTIKESMNNLQAQKTLTFRIVLLLLVMCVIPSSFSMFLVEERVTFSKHLQRIFGIAPWLYQLTNFLYDFTFYFVCCLGIIFIYSFMGVTFFTYSISVLCCAILAFVLYGTSCILFVSILQLLFTTPSLAFALITSGMFFLGVVTTMTIMLLENLMNNDEGLQLAHDICAIVFLMLPQYNLGMVIYRLNFLNMVYTTSSLFLAGINREDLVSEVPLPNPLIWGLAGKHCVVLLGLSFLYLIILLSLEYRCRLKFLRNSERSKTQRLIKTENSLKKHRLVDPDVLREQESVDRLEELDEYGLVVKNVSKAYGENHLAVNNLSFAVGKGQCFGLLGVNGAGKTTTFSMLTGVLNTCCGDVFVNGNSILRDGDNCFRFLGYCPQIDALTGKMTAREHLAFYARVRGIKEEDIHLVVHWGLKHMQLKAYADEQSQFYSGGNKRKLSAAIALVADPPVVLLDEPSAGMDPSTRQFMWNLILQLRRSRRTVVLTSHNMEECESLCTRIAIMVEGQLECIGSIQHLKERFGEGYSLTLKICRVEQVGDAQQFIETHLPGALLKSIHCTTLFYGIKQGEMVLAKAFKMLSQMEKIIKIEDFSLSQTTLDDVFVSFASSSVSPEKMKTAGTASDTLLPAHKQLG